MRKFAILLGGDVKPTARLREQLLGCRAIAADSGMRHAHKLGVLPELWVGDFDSAGVALEQQYAAVPRHVFPRAKDATDGEIAMAKALELGAEELILVGGFGGQFDHAMAHVLALLFLRNKGILAFMSSGSEEAHVCIHELQLYGLAPGTRLSVLPLSDLHGLSIDNVRWPLVLATVKRGSTQTISNETVGDPVIAVQSGEALVVVYPS